MNASIAIGNEVPDFTLKDNNNVDVSLSQYRGKKVLMSWHPLAWTPVCTDQMRALERNLQRFVKENTIPLGFSVDPQPCKEIWANALKITNIKLLADFWPHGKVAMDYGIFNDRDGISQRANFIVDEKGILKWYKIYPSAELPDIEEIFDILKSI
ncbi:redoxin domain-containing protein [Alkalibaculum sp. M08DMB]|uniref:Redoxin domain-containing protein n=1 Tax=Alkalibaculum sporogenes TaxID=2655001 RepID=A0A6A7K4Y8_9FIRM|nr:redoxin domain-containing protein [Alkalibaculum sporogenes]MPW24492.1 redoxin domain-containing protein [Alkalibaculum sporogenes]